MSRAVIRGVRGSQGDFGGQVAVSCRHACRVRVRAVLVKIPQKESTCWQKGASEILDLIVVRSRVMTPEILDLRVSAIGIVTRFRMMISSNSNGT